MLILSKCYSSNSYYFWIFELPEAAAKGYFSNTAQTALFPSSSSINNNLIILSVICNYTTTCCKSVLFHPSRIFMKWIYFSSASRKKSCIIFLSCQLLFLSDHPIDYIEFKYIWHKIVSSSAPSSMTIDCLNFLFKALSHTVWRLPSIPSLFLTPTSYMDTWEEFPFQHAKLSYLQLLSFYCYHHLFWFSC